MMFIKVIIVFSARNVRLAAAFPIVVVFGVWSVSVTELMISVPNAKAFSKCSKCGETAANVKQMNGKLSFVCPGPSKCEASFVHDIPAKPDSKGNYVCKRCKRSSVKSSVARFAKTLCYGSHATNRSDAIRASRCAAGLSSKRTTWPCCTAIAGFAKVQSQHGAWVRLRQMVLVCYVLSYDHVIQINDGKVSLGTADASPGFPWCQDRVHSHSSAKTPSATMPWIEARALTTFRM